MAVPFLYSDDLDTILGSVRSLRKILVFGGPAMGKTALLDEVRARCPGGCELVRGRRGDEQAIQRIVTWADDPPRRGRDLLIDNLDLLFCQEVERAFRNLPDRTDDGLGRIVATSGTPQKWLARQGAPPAHPARARLNTLVHDSTALNAFHPIWLDPWGAGWRKAALLRVQGSLQKVAEEFGGSLAELGERPSRRTFAEMLVRVSDGHPALLGAGFLWLIRHLERRAWRRGGAAGRGASAGSEDSRAADAGSMEPILASALEESQLETIGRAVDWVAAQSTEGLAELLDLAATGDRTSPPAERALLCKSGLVRGEEPGSWVIAGPVVRRCILRRDERMPGPSAAVAVPRAVPRGEVAVRLDPDLRAPDLRGRLSWVASGQARELALTGAPWTILRVLEQAGGELVQVERIREQTGQESDKAVRSAIQRLTNDLRLRDLDGLIVNVRRKGYLFDVGWGRGR